ncbi:hypothetical protein [Zooshikella harenae]|uniref:Uncharacterized protein n=1 Tax=Zooshikella harenae TaxID=2827238 RepID=A0ABS5Z990_9GAMM|nr:hypothetical protein [Zooshikella harenae]MBU2709891.1 hypothetical protein [Zooshikella harenae]
MELPVKCNEKVAKSTSNNPIWDTKVSSIQAFPGGTDGYYAVSFANGESCYIDQADLSILLILSSAYTKNSDVSVTAIKRSWKHYGEVYLAYRAIAY